MESSQQYFVYIVETSCKSLYTGIAIDVDKRLFEHNCTNRGAKYTRSRRPVKLVYKELCESRSAALKREREIKSWDRSKKLMLIENYA